MGYADLIIFEMGYDENNSFNKILTDASYWSILDIILLAKENKDIDRIIVCSDQKTLLHQTEKLGAISEFSNGRDYHLGEDLRTIINKYNMMNVIMMGGKSGSLINKEDFAHILLGITEHSSVIIKNKVVNPSIIAFRPATVINSIMLPYTIEELIFNLNSAGLKNQILPCNLGVNFDIESPSDLAILLKSARKNSNIHSFLLAHGLNTGPVENIMEVIKGEYSNISIIGRVCPNCLNNYSRLLKSRMSVYSENFGKNHLNHNGKGSSLVGLFLEEVGTEKFFKHLSSTTDGAIIDTRVIFAHFKKDPTPWDLFYSDLLEYDKVKDPMIKDFTKIAASCEIPVMLGGYNLVNGGVWALAVACS